MKALKRLSGTPYDMKLVEIDEPKLKNDQWIKVKVEYAGICGSDITMYENECNPRSHLKPPVIPGHEASGTVIEIGKNVNNVKPGDKIVYMTITDNCMSCRFCYSGDWGVCKIRKGLGSSRDGSFAEYIAMPSKNALVLPNSINLQTAALVEPLACAVRLVEEVGKVRRGENVVVMGPGAIGISCGITAIANGANVLMIGTKHSSHRLEVCKKAGMKCIINEGNILSEIREIFGERDIDIAIDAVGSEGTFTLCYKIVRPLGRVVVGAVGVPGIYKVNIGELFGKQIQLAIAHSTRPESWVSSIAIMERYIEVFSSMVGEVFSLDDWEEAYKKAKKETDSK